MDNIKLRETLALAGRRLTYSLALRLLFCGNLYYSINTTIHKRQAGIGVVNPLYNNKDLIHSERINWQSLPGWWHYA